MRQIDLYKNYSYSIRAIAKKTDLKKQLHSKDDYEHTMRGCPRGVMVKALDCRIVVREFVLQSRYYVHSRANTLGKGMNPLILPAIG